MSSLTGVLPTAGVDVGTSAVKVAVMADDPGTGPVLLAAGTERLRKRDPAQVAAGLLADVLSEAGIAHGELAYLASTGEGELVQGRTGHFYGMTTHARGALFLDPDARAVLDAGALHTRGILMDGRAKVLGYRMTSQCASGSGQFLENISRYLGVTLEEIGQLSASATESRSCSSICAVLAETDVINLVSQNIPVPVILKGIHDSMAGRYIRLLTSVKAKGVVLVTGGLAQDIGLVRSLEEAAAEQQAPLTLRTHPQSIYAGAIGAAIWGAFRVRRGAVPRMLHGAAA